MNDGGPAIAFDVPTDKTGGPAFPSVTPPFEDVPGVRYSGMSLRDWFAGMTLQGIVASDADMNINNDKAAEWSYAQADAMIAQREKVQP